MHDLLRNYGESPQRVSTLVAQLHETPALMRIADWTAALMLEFDSSHIARSLPGSSMESFGIGRDATAENNLVFGVFLYVGENETSLREPGRLAVGPYEFPVVVRRGRWLNDATAVDIHPINGTAACWAVSNLMSRQVGFLTAAHLLTCPSRGKEIPTRSGPGLVLDVAPGAGHAYGIDAMLVAPPNNIPNMTGRKTIEPLQLVTAFTPVEFRGMTSGLIKTTITEVTNLFGTLNLHFPARVILAHGGQGGDSGALIQTGLYTARFQDSAGIEHGMGMHLAQVAHCMALEELYEL
jgi:hypothetical protein